LQRIIPTIYEAALKPELWPRTLSLLSEAAGAVGAAYIVSNKWTGEVEWTSFCGPSVEFKPDYLAHYAALDPFRPLCHAAPSGSWIQLSECLAKPVLRNDEWYNDFVVRCGVGDILGARLFENSSHVSIIGVHHGAYQPPFVSERAALLTELLRPLGQAARLHVELRNLDRRSSIALRALNQLATGVIVADGEGRVIELNHAAERLLRRGDGLTIRNGKLCAIRVFEVKKLAALIRAAAAEKTVAAIGRMLVGRRGGQKNYGLTVAPIGGDDLAVFDRPLAIIFVRVPEDDAPSEADVAQAFGLSPAESRVAVALLAGKKLPDIAAEVGVRITTLRTQLRSILRKTGAERQADLIQILSGLPGVSVAVPEAE
jgi:DNA-binding CsgD family transcriptional regulator